MYNLIESDGMIVNTIETYMESCHISQPQSAEQRLYYQSVVRDKWYSAIASRFPRIAAHLLIDGEDSDLAIGINKALKHHCLDPRFTDILLQSLQSEGSPTDCHIVGAYLISVADRYFVEHPVKDDKKNPEAANKEKAEVAKVISHITNAASILLKDYRDAVESICPGFSSADIIAIASALSFENETTIKELVKSDLPVTADIFKAYQKPDNIIRASLKLKKKDFAKLSKNQETFIESLKKFIFTKLNNIPPQVCFKFLCEVYNSISPDMNEYLICVTDTLKNEYPSLYDVSKEFKIKK